MMPTTTTTGLVAATTALPTFVWGVNLRAGTVSPLPKGRDAAAVSHAAAPVVTGRVGHPVHPTGKKTQWLAFSFSKQQNPNRIP